jgi:hypothetical protein
VDFRIIVMTHNRNASLLKLLHSLQDLELDGDRAVIEVWIDVDSEGRANNDTVRAAQSFRWKKGPTRVHVQTSHAGIMGQWIDTWRPRHESKELGLILEDDLSVSPMAYRWLKGVHAGMKNRADFVGATLNSDEMSILSSSPKGPLAAPKNDTILMYKCFGTQGFSPKPHHWRNFQVTIYNSKVGRFKVEVEIVNRFSRGYSVADELCFGLKCHVLFGCENMILKCVSICLWVNLFVGTHFVILSVLLITMIWRINAGPNVFC